MLSSMHSTCPYTSFIRCMGSLEGFTCLAPPPLDSSALTAQLARAIAKNANTCHQSGAGNALQRALLQLQIALTACRSALTCAFVDLRPRWPNKFALKSVSKISRPIRHAQKVSEIVLTSNGMLTYNPLWGGLARPKPSGIAQMLR